VGPHTRRHALITAALDAGVPPRDVREAASPAGPRTTMRYDRARTSLDRHATCIVAAYLAGAARRLSSADRRDSLAATDGRLAVSRSAAEAIT